MKIRRHMSKALHLGASIFLLIITPGSYAIAQICVPPPTDLASWWPGDGNALDIVGSNDGALVGNATFAAGQVGLGFLLDGDGDYVEIADDPSLDLPQFTVDAWIFIDRAQLNAQFHAIVGKHNGTLATPGFFLGYDTRNIAGVPLTQDALQIFVVQESGIGSTTFITNALQTPGFYHVAGTFDGSNARLYLDGTLVATGNPISFAGFNDLPLRIGAMNFFELTGINDRFEGIIDEVELFDRALSGPEIQAIFLAGSGGNCRVTPVIDSAIDLINGLGLDPSTTAKLLKSLQKVQDAFDAGNLSGARKLVSGFVGDLEKAVKASSLATDDANLLLKKAGTILGEITFP